MLKDKEKLYQIYHTMMSIAVTWAFILVANQYFSLRVNIFLTVIFAFLPTILIYLFDINRKNVISYILLAGIIPLLALIFWIMKTNPIKWVVGFIHWCGKYNGSDKIYRMPYAIVALLGVAVLTAILCYFITKYQVAREVLAVVILVGMIILCVSKTNVNKAFVAISIFYILTIVVELYEIIYSKKYGRQEKKEGILYLTPICLLLAVLSISLPSKPEPIQWTGIKHIYNNILGQIEIWKTDFNFYFGSGNGEFFLNLSGYSDDNGKLGTGSVVKDNGVALKVYSMQQGSLIYLIGSVSDTYTGNSWEKSHKDYITGKKDYLLDYSELFLALTRQDMNVLKKNQFCKRQSIKISYNNIRTKTLFYPLLTYKNEMESTDQDTLQEAPQITFKKAKSKGTEYSNVYYDMNLEGAAFQKMLREADSFSYGNVKDMDQDVAEYVDFDILPDDMVKGLLSDKDIYKILGDRADLIRDKYTQLPKELPNRVRQLAVDITGEYNTKYDKLKAIEAFLLNYKYSLQTEKLAKEKDFTDDFLFESKEGYCTSFATAMAVLGRCIGIPMRYVEGFAARCDVMDSDGMYEVKNSQAHAWTEAYLEGIGWIPFEATAPYHDMRYTKWADVIQDDSEVESGTGSMSYDYHQFSNQMGQPVTHDIVKVEKKDTGEALVIVFIVLVSLLSLLLAVLIYYILLKLHYKKVFEKADYSRKMYLHFLLILRLLKREGYTLGQQETILMLSERIKDLEFDNIKFIEVAYIYMRYRYAKTPVTREEFSKVEAYYIGLSDKQKKEVKWWKVWLWDFIYLIQTERLLRRQYNNA